MFGEIGLDKLLMLLVMFLLLFGAKRIPEIGRSLGKGIREFKGSLAGLDEPAVSPQVQERGMTMADMAIDAPIGDSQPLRRLNG
ncbi:MAG TPA: twin-arginine translocase TatA/TatE family subunit [Gemmatimonadaceae bacterium]|jgi:sec-independent protein translocase protein TatA|nr:twin-arginine translocase TatA/TatE family subunit [Gemmatimonadaceae bacterium]